MFQAGVCFEQLKKFLDLRILLPFLNQIRNGDLAHLWEQFPHKCFNLLIYDLIRDAEHLETRTDRAVNQKL